MRINSVSKFYREQEHNIRQLTLSLNYLIASGFEDNLHFVDLPFIFLNGSEIRPQYQQAKIVATTRKPDIKQENCFFYISIVGTRSLINEYKWFIFGQPMAEVSRASANPELCSLFAEQLGNKIHANNAWKNQIAKNGDFVVGKSTDIICAPLSHLNAWRLTNEQKPIESFFSIKPFTDSSASL